MTKMSSAEYYPNFDWDFPDYKKVTDKELESGKYWFKPFSTATHFSILTFDELKQYFNFHAYDEPDVYTWMRHCMKEYSLIPTCGCYERYTEIICYVYSDDGSHDFSSEQHCDAWGCLDFESAKQDALRLYHKWMEQANNDHYTVDEWNYMINNAWARIAVEDTDCTPTFIWTPSKKDLEQIGWTMKEED